MGRSGVRLAAARLVSTQEPVGDVTFQPQGGTGPARAIDTEIWLTQGVGAESRVRRITVSWVTGQAWIDSPAAVPTGILSP